MHLVPSIIGVTVYLEDFEHIYSNKKKQISDKTREKLTQLYFDYGKNPIK